MSISWPSILASASSSVVRGPHRINLRSLRYQLSSHHKPAIYFHYPHFPPLKKKKDAVYNNLKYQITVKGSPTQTHSQPLLPKSLTTHFFPASDQQPLLARHESPKMLLRRCQATVDVNITSNKNDEGPFNKSGARQMKST